MLSGHGTGAKWILENVKAGSYIEIVNGTVYVYSSYTDYKAKSGLTVASGSAVGTLPTVSGKFIGWYNGDVKVSSETIFNKNTTLSAKFS